jgi:hypothetical protein
MGLSEDESKSLTGVILRAVGSGMLITCLAFAAKAVFGEAAMAMDHLLTATFAGVVGVASMAGAAAADRECARAEEAKKWPAYRGGQGPSTAPSRSVEIESPEECERWLERLARERDQGAGKGICRKADPRSAANQGCERGSSTASPSAKAASLRAWSAETRVTGPEAPA